ncbi:MAG: phage holin family protein [Pseudomonadota bacterium]|uniref:phage holin family protein n=1 Tax=Sulfuricystis thermophila TaxID=2496847 RepID=UPI001035EB9D|nr:phage holin family protein [Sulfuricystis thermophila]MDI6749565.1 phage holin family protein [Rhodocyclaceae bacterium]
MPDASPGLLASLRGLATTGVAMIRTRLELLKVEAQEEVGRITGLLLWGGLAILSGVLGLAFLGVFLTVLLWESHRVLALGIFTALFLFAALIASWVALRLLKQGSRLFAASLAELQRDEAALRNEDGV